MSTTTTLPTAAGNNLEAEIRAAGERSFAENLDALSDVANRMREMTARDLDQVVPLVERATAVHRSMATRIEQVHSMLRQTIDTNAAPGGAGDTPAP